jgi:hypothetical protein
LEKPIVNESRSDPRFLFGFIVDPLVPFDLSEERRELRRSLRRCLLPELEESLMPLAWLSVSVSESSNPAAAIAAADAMAPVAP